MMAGIQITLRKAGGDHERVDVTFPDGAVDEVNIQVRREAFSIGINYVSVRAKADGRSDDAADYEVVDGPGGQQAAVQQAAAIKKVATISHNFAKGIEEDSDLNLLMDKVLATCTSTIQDAGIIKAHLDKVYKHIVAKQDGHGKVGVTQLVHFIGFLEYGYQLTKKYIAKMRSEGKVGVFLASVVWGLVSYSYNSGILSIALLRQLSGRSSNPISVALSAAVTAVMAVPPQYKAVTVASVIGLLGVGIAYWYFKK